MKKKMMVYALGTAMMVLGQDAASARAAYQMQNAVQEVSRLSQQFDQLAANHESLVGRMNQLEGGNAGLDELRAEIVSLKAQIDQLKRDQESMRREIVADLGKRIAALPRPAVVPPPPPPPPAAAPANVRRPSAPARPSAPEYTGNYYEHKVEPGQTLSEISKGYDVPLAKILKANPGLKPNALRVGQKIKVPAE